jgi:hypothetical protein
MKDLGYKPTQNERKILVSPTPLDMFGMTPQQRAALAEEVR